MFKISVIIYYYFKSTNNSKGNWFYKSNCNIYLNNEPTILKELLLNPIW
jgi:hypothetical protein